MNKKTRYDVIIIGSGMGALTVGGLLAKAKGKKVLVLEQHATPGGYTHDFKRAGGYVFNTGVHYIGTMADIELKVFNYLTENKVTLQSLPDPQELFAFPDIEVRVPSDWKKYRELLLGFFPDEEKSIVNYFNDIKNGRKWVEYFIIRQALPPGIRFLFRLIRSKYERLVYQTTQHYLDSRFKNPLLKSVLSSRWIDYGLPPSKSAFAIHSLIEDHYMSGAGFPVQGTSSLCNAIQPLIEIAGGTIKCKHQVTKILVLDGKAVGVRFRTDDSSSEQDVYAPVIVSDTGAKNTYETLLQNQYCDTLFDTSAVNTGTSVVQLYVGLSRSPKSLGTAGEIAWIYRSYDHESIFDGTDALNGNPQFCFVNFPLANKDIADNLHKYTAEILCPVDYRHFLKWKECGQHFRGSEYHQMKEKIAHGLIELVEKQYPGFKEIISFYELSTPLTTEHFTHHPFGAIYGIPATPERFRQPFISNKTPVKNLYLTGADAGMPGIVGVMMGGMVTASLIAGPFGIFDIMGSVMSGRSRIKSSF
jgi:phytoene dehydrogenase-like protein